MKISFRHFLTALAFLATLGLADGPVEAQDFKFKSADAPVAAETTGASGEEGAEQATGPVQVGNAAKVTRLVKGYLEEEDEERDIEMMADVYQNEIIETGAKSAIDIKFLDNTRLTLGPNSTMILDQFVFDPRPGKGKVVVNATKGVLRFVSGKLASSAYKIKTPVATMGVRGTEFTVLIDNDGGTTVAVSDGVVSVANLAGVEVEVEAGLATKVRAQKKDEKAPPPPEAPAPAPPEVFEMIGEMDLALEEAGEGEDEELAEGEEGEGEGEGEEAGLDEDAVTEEITDLAEGEIIPEDVLAALLGEEGDLEALEAYLNGEGLDPEMAAARMIALLQAMVALGDTSGDTFDMLMGMAYEGDMSEDLRLLIEGVVAEQAAEVIAEIETAAGDLDPVFESEVGASPN
ncbi:MAG: FecR domain-containing protein [Alphaproteobacteria bacterium]|nr:FecR domain-containing protein [Alphaproteobacteria bacterium]